MRPFRALRPKPDCARQVASVPYDVVNAEEARALAGDNPLSFLRVSRAEIDLPADTNPYADAVYQRAAANFTTLRAEAMVEEAEPAIYVYRLKMGTHVQTGLAACFSVDDYARDIIKKHEKTRRDKEDDRTRHIIDLRAQSGPVFLVYRHADAVDRATDAVTAGVPLYDFTAPDGIVHTIWRADQAQTLALVEALARVPALYIADGHHRAASAARANAHFAPSEPGDDREHAWFVAVAFPDNRTQILPYHRVVKDLQGRTPAQFVAAVAERCAVRPGLAAPLVKGECGLYVGGAWHTVTLTGGPSSAARAGGAVSSTAAGSADDVISSLDVSRLQDRIIAPLLGIEDLRTDKRIDFVGGIRGTQELERLVNAGKAAAGFALSAVTVGELIAVSDAGAIMPPKSTWFEPKLRDGLLTHLI
jgi:uncharacterized protein (DUF1015 family)